MTAMHFDADTGEILPPPHDFDALRARLDFLPDVMRNARRWLLWTRDKVPHYVTGQKRHGTLDAGEDVAQFGTLDQALDALDANGRFAGVGFALGFDATHGLHWQGLDLDDALAADGQFTTERARALFDATEGYAERSPSGRGLHVIGLGDPFRAIKWKRPGDQAIEFYASARFFTVTGRMMREGDPIDLAPIAERVRAGLVAAGQTREHKARERVNGAAAYLDRMPENLRIWIKAHPIEAALAEHGYQQMGDRWLSPRSESGVPGVVVLDELRACTFHASDAGIGTPTANDDGETFNSFDTEVRYRFGDDRNRALRELLRERPQEPAGEAHDAPADAEHPHAEEPRVEPADEPQNLFRDIVAPRFDPDDVPAPIRRMAEAFSGATGFDVSGSLMAATVAAAAAIDDRHRLAVRPSSDWFESARLWAVLIGTPSAGKSPTIRAATDPIKDLHSELFAKWLAANEHADEKEQEEPKPALFTSDATTEALADRLRDNPRGILMLTEEFASWIGSIDAYRDGAGARNRGEWLQLYDGGPHQVDRVKRGSFLVPNWGASVLAACTPAGLRDQVRKLPDDGLIHRFMPCIMGAPKEPGRESARDALRDWSVRLRELYAATTCEKPTSRIRISGAAQIDFDHEAGEIRRAIDAVYDLSPALASHIGKHPGMLARVALTFHLIDGRAGDAIEPDTMQMAVRFLRTVRRHAAAMFLGILSTAPALEIARSVARSIVADASRPTSIGRAYMTHRCRAFRQAQDFERRLAVQVLEDGHWLYPVTDSRAYGGWGASAWAVNERVFDLFAGEGEAHRDRRQVVREFISEGA